MQFGIAEAVDHWAKYRPSSIAAYANGTPCTYAALNSLVAAMAVEVEAVAVDQQRVAVAFGSKLNHLTAILGVLRAGRSVVLINTGLSTADIRVSLKDAEVKALLYDETQARLAELVPSSAPVSPQSLSVSSPAPLRQRGRSDEWGVLFSSGTTGIPKGIERDHESMVTELIGWCLELGLTRHSRFYIGRPIYYTGGLVLTLATLLVGGAAILNEYGRDDFQDTWTDYQRTLCAMPIDFAFFIPDQLRWFLSDAATQERPLRARTVLTMGGPITGIEKQLVASKFGCQIVESWGNSESLGTITDPEDVHSRPDSIGRPFLTDEMSVVDEDCLPVPAGELGRLAGGESAGFVRYCNRPDDTAIAKQKDLIISEDVGFVDDKGFFYIRGRVQDRVVVADGSTVFLQELETALRSLPMIRACCIVAIGTDALFCIAAVLSVPQSPGDLADAIKQQLGSGINVAKIRVVDELPLLPAGKVNRLAVQRDFEQSV